MGYMDLSLSGSDMAAGFADECGNALAELLSKEMQEPATNEFNTSGMENAAMFFEEVICKNAAFRGNSKLEEIAPKLVAGIKARMAEAEKTPADEWPDREYHLRRYRQIIRKIKHWTEE